MKAKEFLVALLRKAGKETSEKYKTMLDAIAEVEIDDEAANEALDSLMNDAEAEANTELWKKVKTSTKAEVLDGIDAVLKDHEGKLSAEQKTQLGKLGKDTNKRYQYMLKTFSERNTTAGDTNADDLQTQVQGVIDSKLASGELVKKADFETISAKSRTAQMNALNQQILSKAIRHPKLSQATSADRHFERNFLADLNETLSEGLGSKKIKAMIDPETGAIVQKDNAEQGIVLDGKRISIDEVVGLVVEQHYAKNSEPAAGSGTVTVNGTPVTGLSEAKARMLKSVQ